MTEVKPANQQVSNPSPDGSLTARAFRDLVDAFANFQIHGNDEREAAMHRFDAVRDQIEHQTANENARSLLHRARDAARRGEHDCIVAEFPSAQCTDGGRAINVGDANWPSTLTGDAAGLYQVWSAELRPRSFELSARILSYPHGQLGDVGLFLSWRHGDDRDTERAS